MSYENNLIKNEYKISLLIKLCVVLLISSLVSGFIFSNFVKYDIGQSYTNTKFIIRSVQNFLFPTLWFSITILTLLLSLGTIIISVFVSHRIAGPIYRLEVSMKDFKEGTFYRIHLRTKDQIKGFVKLLNEFTESLLHNFTKAKKHAFNVKGLVEEERKECESDNVNYQKLLDLNEKLKGEIKSLKNTFSEYKV